MSWEQAEESRDWSIPLPPPPLPPDSFVLLGCFLICSWFWNDFCLIFLYWKKYRRRNRTVTDQLVDTHWILMIVTNLIKCRQFLLIAVWGFPEVNKTCFSKNVNSLTNWADRLDRQRLDMKMFSFSFSGHLGLWPAFNVKNKLTTAYVLFCDNWDIFFKYC